MIIFYGSVFIIGFIAIIAYMIISVRYMRGGAPFWWKLILLPLVAVTFICGFAFSEGRIYESAVITYVDVENEYKTNESMRKADHQDLKCDEIEYHRLPDLRFRNPKVGNMSLRKFDQFSDQREHLKLKIQKDKHNYQDDTRYSLGAQNPSLREVHNARHNMNNIGYGWYIHNTKFEHHQLPRYEHEYKLHPDYMKGEQD